MKKITTFLVALLAITMATQAQTILLKENFDGKKDKARNITLTTGKAVGEKIALRIDAEGPVEIDGATGTHVNEKMVTYTITNQSIAIRGEIQQFVCRGNKITALNTSNATTLTWLDCGMNELTSLDVSKNASLFHLNCSDNKLKTLDLSKNTVLGVLYCFNNQLTSLNTGEISSLEGLYCYNNRLASLDLSKSAKMSILLCRENSMKELDITKCAALKGLDCNQNQLKSLDVTQNPSISLLYCVSNQLTRLDLTKNVLLAGVNCSKNQLESIDISKNSELTWFDCSTNKLTALDLTENDNLTRLYCFSNQIAGEAMDKLLASLANYPAPTEPNGDEGFYIINTKDTQEENVCTKKQVDIAKDKGWKVYDFNGKWSDRKEYNGSEATEPEETSIMLPYTETFESCSKGARPKGWTAKDLDGDGHNWQTNLFIDDEKAGRGNSQRCAVSASFDTLEFEALTPKNELISPLLEGLKSINYWVSATDPDDFAEHYKVYVTSKENPADADWEKIFEETLTEEQGGGQSGLEDTYVQRTMNVPEASKRVKFVHTDCSGLFWIRLDDITFSPWPASTEGIQAERVKLATERGTIVIDTPTADATLCVFDLEGRCIAKQTTVAGENRVAVKAGYYVLSVGGFKGKVYVP